MAHKLSSRTVTFRLPAETVAEIEKRMSRVPGRWTSISGYIKDLVVACFDVRDVTVSSNNNRNPFHAIISKLFRSKYDAS
jgi:Arc/MetJ-type ribon-helix-helix transcriptional regulator